MCAEQRRRAAVQLALPADLAGLEVEVVDHPALRPPTALTWSCSDRRGPGDRRRLLAGADRRRQEDVIVPDDRRAPAEAGNVGLPHDVLRSRSRYRAAPDRPGSTPASGPRNCGHWSAADIVVSARSVSATVVTILRIGVSLPSSPTLKGSAYNLNVACRATLVGSPRRRP